MGEAADHPAPSDLPGTSERPPESPQDTARAIDPTTRSAIAPPPIPASEAQSLQSHPDDDEPEPFTQARRRRWAELIRHVWLDDPELCERCGGRLRIAGVCTSPRDDEAIRRELEARGEWAPPWARAPPANDAPREMSPTSPSPSVPASPDHLDHPADPPEPGRDPDDDEYDEWIADPWAEEEGAKDATEGADGASSSGGSE